MSKFTERITPENLPYVVGTMKLLDRWRLALQQTQWKKTEHFNPPDTWCACQQDVPVRIRISLLDLSPELHEPACHALRQTVEQLRIQEIAFAGSRAISHGQAAFLTMILFLQMPTHASVEALRLFREAGSSLEEAQRLTHEFCMNPSARWRRSRSPE